MRNPGLQKVDQRNPSRGKSHCESWPRTGLGPGGWPMLVSRQKIKPDLHPDILILFRARIEEGEMSVSENGSWKTRLVERGFPDRSFDIEFWQEQGDEAIFAAAWEMVELAEEISHGRKPTLQRTVTTLKPIRS